MDIALLVPAPFDTVSGGYLYDRRMVEGLRAQGHGVRVVELAGSHPAADAAAQATAGAALASLRSGEVAVVDGLGLPAFAPHEAALRARGVVGLIHHPVCLEQGADRALLEPIERALFAACTRLIVTSPMTATTLGTFGVDAARVAVVEPGTDPAPRAKGSGRPGCRILAVGSIIPRKGHDVLLRALERLTDLDWTLRIAGAPADPVHLHSLQALAEELGLTARVTFLGALDRAALEAEYAAADLFALATHYEGYGMVVAEAQARGLPMALCTGGAVADLVAPGSAILAPPGEFNSLSRGMRRPLYDPLLRAQMADAAWRAGQTLPRWDAQAARFATILEETHG
jgi:glycosyltransferase involved in cell wall biosynthesis